LNRDFMQTQTPADTVQPNQQVEYWFEYPVRVQVHHTDYTSVVWHGTYVAWLEEARVECLRSIGVEYADWVAMGYELPVVELSIRYHRSLKLGAVAIVKTRMRQVKGVRIHWDYQIQSLDEQELYVTAQVTLVAIESQSGKILRRLPLVILDTLIKLPGER
jgi:acyl-CoA thioester hydrolase